VARTGRVYNITRDSEIASEIVYADNLISRFFGLMGQPELAAGRGLLIVGDNAIHSFFMRFRFDACFLDKENRVLFMIHSMKPWRASRFVRGGNAVLELPAGALQATGTALGDQLRVEAIGR